MILTVSDVALLNAAIARVARSDERELRKDRQLFNDLDAIAESSNTQTVFSPYDAGGKRYLKFIQTSYDQDESGPHSHREIALAVEIGARPDFKKPEHEDDNGPGPTGGSPAAGVVYRYAQAA